MLTTVYDVTMQTKKEQNLVRVTLRYVGLTRELAIKLAQEAYPDFDLLHVFPWNKELMKGD